MRFYLLVIVLFFQAGCSIPYLFHLSGGQFRILEKKEPIEEVLESPEFSAEEKGKLRLVLEVREFAFNELGLERNGNYTEFVKLDRDAVAYNIVVCPKDSLKPYSWWFPFSGSISYLGFFSKSYAIEERDAYQAEGYDTYLRGVSAYSTLGWFDDPVFSTMLRYRSHSLVNLIIHELAHATVYKGGDTEFNEGMATFLGNQGGLAFIQKKYGPASDHYKQALGEMADDLVFSAFITNARKKLNALYSRPLRREVKIKERERVFSQIQQEFKKIRPQFQTHLYDGFERMPLNNAVIVGFGQYYGHLDVFERVWKYYRRSFKKTVEAFRQAQDEQSPVDYLRSLL